MNSALRPKVVVALSGGVDSAVAAALLKRENFAFPQGQGNPERSRRVDLVGVFMKFWPARNATHSVAGGSDYNRCCSTEAEVRARKTAKVLKIPFYVINFEKEFKKRIVDYFLEGYKRGITPNPCVVCNKEIKFGLLLKKALSLDADYVATGHYARIRKFVSSKQIRYSLMTAKDKNKDQSYFLWMLNQKQLGRILFPIGDYRRKEVEKLAKKFKLPVLGIKKSVEVCFVPAGINDFLKKYLKEKPGKIIDTKGNIIGEHRGLWFYTIGQRRGIGLLGGPYWVKNKDLKKNVLIVAKNKNDLEKKELRANNINWISGKKPKLPMKVKTKIRYRHKEALAVITKSLNHPTTLSLIFKKPQRAITPGQSVVFYRGQEILGGGVISGL